MWICFVSLADFPPFPTPNTIFVQAVCFLHWNAKGIWKWPTQSGCLFSCHIRRELNLKRISEAIFSSCELLFFSLAKSLFKHGRVTPISASVWSAAQGVLRTERIWSVFDASFWRRHWHFSASWKSTKPLELFQWCSVGCWPACFLFAAFLQPWQVA